MRTEEFRIQRIRFLAEQDGPAELNLKRHLASYLGCVPEVELAFLVRIAHKNLAGKGVALCLVGGKTRAIEIVQSVGAIFHELFQYTESLDILFLNEEQKREVNLTARPFYEADVIEHQHPN